MNSRIFAQRMIRAQVSVVPRRTVVSGYPRVRVSLAEKFAHGFTFIIGVTAVPAWVLCNMKHYREGGK